MSRTNTFILLTTSTDFVGIRILPYSIKSKEIAGVAEMLYQENGDYKARCAFFGHEHDPIHNEAYRALGFKIYNNRVFTFTFTDDPPRFVAPLFNGRDVEFDPFTGKRYRK